MRVLQAFATDQKLVDEGRLCEIEFQGQVICRVRVRPADAALNADYRSKVAKLGRELKTQAGDTIDAAQDAEYLYEIYAETIVTDWEWTDPADKKDKALAFSRDNAIEVFRKAPKFFEAVQRVARDWANYRAEFEDDATGN